MVYNWSTPFEAVSTSTVSIFLRFMVCYNRLLLKIESPEYWVQASVPRYIPHQRNTAVYCCTSIFAHPYWWGIKRLHLGKNSMAKSVWNFRTFTVHTYCTHLKLVLSGATDKPLVTRIFKWLLLDFSDVCLSPSRWFFPCQSKLYLTRMEQSNCTLRKQAYSNI